MFSLRSKEQKIRSYLAARRRPARGEATKACLCVASCMESSAALLQVQPTADSPRAANRSGLSRPRTAGPSHCPRCRSQVRFVLSIALQITMLLQRVLRVAFGETPHPSLRARVSVSQPTGAQAQQWRRKVICRLCSRCRRFLTPTLLTATASVALFQQAWTLIGALQP